MTATAMFMLGMSVGMFIFQAIHILDKHAELKKEENRRAR